MIYGVIAVLMSVALCLEFGGPDNIPANRMMLFSAFVVASAIEMYAGKIIRALKENRG